MSKNKPLTYNQTLISMLEFLEVAVHTILFVRRLYPADLFTRKKKWDAPVYQSRHPALNEYISGAVKAVGEELSSGNVERVIVVIKDKHEVALERFVFEFQTVLDPPPTWQRDVSIEGALTPAVFSQYFRSFLIRLSLLENRLGLLVAADDPTFAIVLEMKDTVPSEPKGKSKDPAPWVPAMDQHTASGTAEQSEVHVVRAVETGIINLGLTIQESQEKLDRLSHSQ